MYFQINYALLTVVVVVVSVLKDGWSIATICLLALAWMAFLKKNEDPNWEVSVGGVPLGKSQRWVLMAIASAVIVLCISGLASRALLRRD